MATRGEGISKTRLEPKLDPAVVHADKLRPRFPRQGFNGAGGARIVFHIQDQRACGISAPTKGEGGVRGFHRMASFQDRGKEARGGAIPPGREVRHFGRRIAHNAWPGVVGLNDGDIRRRRCTAGGEGQVVQQRQGPRRHVIDLIR
jgi:hypothetical protein